MCARVQRPAQCPFITMQQASRANAGDNACRSLEETKETKKIKDKDYKPEICAWRVGMPKTHPSQQVKAFRTPWNQATVVELLDQQATN